MTILFTAHPSIVVSAGFARIVTSYKLSCMPIKRAIILAGGQGTRLRPITLEIPKPLVPVQGEPILNWLVRLAAKHGLERASVIYPAEWKRQFESWRDEKQPLNVEILEEAERMGTLGYLVHEMRLEDEPVVVINGDVLNGLDLSKLAAFHERARGELPDYAATVALTEVPDPSAYGVAEMDGQLIRRFHEKPEHPPSNLINAGIYVIEPSVLKEVARDRRYLMFEQDLFPRLAIEGRLGGCPLFGPWHDCGTLERWEKAIREWPGV